MSNSKFDLIADPNSNQNANIITRHDPYLNNKMQIKESEESYKILDTNLLSETAYRLIADRVFPNEFYYTDRHQVQSLIYAQNSSCKMYAGLVFTKGGDRTNIIIASKGTDDWTELESLEANSEKKAMVDTVITYLEAIGCRVFSRVVNHSVEKINYDVFFSLANENGKVKLAGRFGSEIDNGISILQFNYIAGDARFVEMLITDLDLVSSPVSNTLTLTTALGVAVDGKLIMSKTSVLGKSKIRLGDDLFYPFMQDYGSVSEYFDEFLSSKQPVLILIGPPGTGKSTFVRTMATYKKKSVLSVSREDAINSVGFMDNFLKGGWDVLLVEDAEQFIKPRSEGNKLMSDILNTTDGIDGAGSKKIIFTTNLPDKSSIDEALMREGRCFDVLDFPLLSSSEAELIQDKYILDKELHQDLTSKRDWSLAQVLNPPAKRKRKVRQKQTFGFTST